MWVPVCLSVIHYDFRSIIIMHSAHIPRKIYLPSSIVVVGGAGDKLVFNSSSQVHLPLLFLKVIL